jgi:hypothetical protein
MSAPETTERFDIGPVWRDSNIRSGPSLESAIVYLVLPDHGGRYDADGWVHGDEVVEGSIVSDVWLRLAPGRWCSAVNFDQGIVAAIPARARLAPGQD